MSAPVKGKLAMTPTERAEVDGMVAASFAIVAILRALPLTTWEAVEVRVLAGRVLHGSGKECSDAAWGAAVRTLRGNRLIDEVNYQSTVFRSLGPEHEICDTVGWPDECAAKVLTTRKAG